LTHRLKRNPFNFTSRDADDADVLEKLAAFVRLRREQNFILSEVIPLSGFGRPVMNVTSDPDRPANFSRGRNITRKD
jgi:hypothetical protein